MLFYPVLYYVCMHVSAVYILYIIDDNYNFIFYESLTCIIMPYLRVEQNKP